MSHRMTHAWRAAIMPSTRRTGGAQSPLADTPAASYGDADDAVTASIPARAAPARARRVALQAMLALGLAPLLPAPARAQCSPAWSQWRSFAARFVQNDGRVVNRDSGEEETVSEAQAYALFFALVANEPQAFERILTWTRDNLAGGDLTSALPAWKWGKRPNGSWGVIDPNSAADADLWLAYALLEAGRLWKSRGYGALGKTLMEQIARREVVTLSGLGTVLLPGPEGFRLDGGVWRLNPSYLALPLLRRLAVEDPQGPWNAIAESTLLILASTAKQALAPDWIAWSASGGFHPDPEKGETGSFDAIRVYLWAGMTDPADPLHRPILDALAGMEAHVSTNPVPPLSVGAWTGARDGTGPIGFSGALLPYLRARRQLKLAQQQELRIVAMLEAGKQLRPLRYYDAVLLLFGKGHTEHRFRFDKQGRLNPRWRQACDSATRTKS